MEPIRPYAKHVTEPDVYRNWAIGLMAASFVVGTVATLVIANSASINPPVAALKGTTLANVIIGVSGIGGIVLGISSGICLSRRKLTDEDEARLNRQREIKALCASGDRERMRAELQTLKNLINAGLTIPLRDIVINADGSTNVIQSNLNPACNNPERIGQIRELLADYREILLAISALR